MLSTEQGGISLIQSLSSSFTFDVSVSRHAVTEQLHVSPYRLHRGSLWGQLSTISGTSQPPNSRTIHSLQILTQDKHKQTVGEHIRV